MSEDAERAIRAAHQRADMEGAVRCALAHYQTEVYSFLYARLGSESDAHEVFAQMSEDLWRGIEGFEWRCAFRTWLYKLARHAAVRFERSPPNQRRRRQSLSRVADAPVQERSRTRPYLRTDVKDRFAKLRATLSPDEQALLVLRVDRAMSWEDVARVLHDSDDTDLLRRAANLRQRYRQLVCRLRERARDEGIVGDD